MLSVPHPRRQAHAWRTAGLLTLLALAAAPAPCAEFRGLWADAFHNGFLNSTQANTLASHARTYNFNAVVVQMRRRGDAWYIPQAPNQEPRTTALASGYDALAAIINACHNGTPRIEVHCWVPTMLIWGDVNNPPSQSGHVYNLHPEWLMRNSAGATHIGEGFYLDPGHPDAMVWNLNMAKDIVSRYNIDGFHWDYIRYPTTDSGYNPTAIARYNAEFGLTGQPSYTSAQFATWRRRQVTDFVRWTSSELLAIKPGIDISASVFASRSDAYNARFQDWAAWANEGIVDILFPMNYTSTNSTFNSRVDDIALNQGIRKAYVGQGAYLNTASNTVTQLNYVRSKGLWGTNLYSYAVPNSGTVNQTGTLNTIKTNYQPTYTGVPSLPWKANPTKGIIKGTITRQSTGGIVYNATITIGTRTQRSESHGKYAFFEMSPGTHSVSATATGLGTATGSVSVTAGGVATLNLALPTGGGGTPTDIIVDNSNSGFSASANWSTGTSAADKYGTDYRFHNTGSVTDLAQWTFSIPSARSYEVYAWWSQGTNRSALAPYLIAHSAGSTTVNKNQQTGGGAWQTLGTYSYNSGSSNVRLSCWTTSGYVVIADAVKLTPR